ncbi:MAG: GGDEF domain-containing phosphodiesterase [Gammaproteobacteria bacterium]|nr:GGDEF domain-containing phosphodiesterase [Gammaproteobacteria bacterium]
MADIWRRPKAQDLFSRELRDAISRSHAADERLALLVVRIKEFEKVEGALGYPVSQELAGRLLERIHGMLRKADHVQKVGDKKYWITLSNPKNEGHAILAANKISRLAAEPMEIDGHSIKLDVTSGIAIFPDHADEPEELVRRADLALAAAQEADAGYQVYTIDSTSKVTSLWQIESALDRALQESELELYYQPKIDLRSMQPCGMEALIRWNDPENGLVMPHMFLPVAEQSGKLEAITNFVINTALRQQSELPAKWSDLPVSVNISASILAMDHFVPTVRDALKIWGSKPSGLVLEVTEDSVIRNQEQTFAVLNALRAEGIHISIDDFGTGYSSMALFKDLPADELKIDKSFILKMIGNQGEQHIVRTIIELAHAFGFSVVAEGVENEATLNALVDLQCDIAQGFWFARPMPHHQLVEWLGDEFAARPRSGQTETSAP